MSEEERDIAQGAVLSFVKEYRSIADALDEADRAHVARVVRRMAEEIEAGLGRSFRRERR